jgi:hypothetical protein
MVFMVYMDNMDGMVYMDEMVRLPCHPSLPSQPCVPSLPSDPSLPSLARTNLPWAIRVGGRSIRTEIVTKKARKPSLRTFSPVMRSSKARYHCSAKILLRSQPAIALIFCAVLMPRSGFGPFFPSNFLVLSTHGTIFARYSFASSSYFFSTATAHCSIHFCSKCAPTLNAANAIANAVTMIAIVFMHLTIGRAKNGL